jgi:hypothetical protein
MSTINTFIPVVVSFPPAFQPWRREEKKKKTIGKDSKQENEGKEWRKGREEKSTQARLAHERFLGTRTLLGTAGVLGVRERVTAARVRVRERVLEGEREREREGERERERERDRVGLAGTREREADCASVSSIIKAITHNRTTENKRIAKRVRFTMIVLFLQNGD